MTITFINKKLVIEKLKPNNLQDKMDKIWNCSRGAKIIIISK
jgi:hypothetical protein